jgi:hypothetical protein
MKIIVIVAAAAFLAACGGGSSSTAHSSTASHPIATASSTAHSSTASHSYPELHNGRAVAASSIMYALRSGGFAVTDVMPVTDWAYSGESLDVKINGDPAYLNAFANAKDAREWTALSLGFGGIAVVGDTWSISLDCAAEPSMCPVSRSLAPKIASALDAQVKDGSTQ